MERKDADCSTAFIKKLSYVDVKAYKHIAKVLEYILYRLDTDVPAPSVYYPSEMGAPDLGDGIPDDITDQWADLPDVPFIEPPVEVGVSESYVEDAAVPLVLGYTAAQAPFLVDTSAPSGSPETTPSQTDKTEAAGEGGEATHHASGDVSGEGSLGGRQKRVEVTPSIDKKKAQAEALKRVKERLRKTKVKDVAKE